MNHAGEQGVSAASDIRLILSLLATITLAVIFVAYSFWKVESLEKEPFWEFVNFAATSLAAVYAGSAVYLKLAWPQEQIERPLYLLSLVLALLSLTGYLFAHSAASGVISLGAIVLVAGVMILVLIAECAFQWSASGKWARGLRIATYAPLVLAYVWFVFQVRGVL